MLTTIFRSLTLTTCLLLVLCTDGSRSDPSDDPTSVCSTNSTGGCKAFEACCGRVCGQEAFLLTCKIQNGVKKARCSCAGSTVPESLPGIVGPPPVVPTPADLPGPTTPRPPPPRPPPPPPTIIECGRRLIAKPGRIFGGTEATPHSWPWQISLRLRRDGGKGEHKCGGSIVTPTNVITAAHCLDFSKDPKHYKVIAGIHNHVDPEPGHQAVGVANLTLHPDYNKPFEKSNDLAILTLDKPLVFNRYVRPVCIPEKEVAVDTPCATTGWGKTKDTENSQYLLQVVVDTIRTDTCNASTFHNGEIDDTMLCAAADGKDACEGDSGGPFVCIRPNRQWDLQGVVSWGEGCAVETKPGVYTRVILLKRWITDVIGEIPTRFVAQPE